MEWVCQCLTCNEEIYSAANGNFVEAAARMHIKEHKDHRLLVGYVVRVEGDNIISNGKVVEVITRLRKFYDELKATGIVGKVDIESSGNRVWWSCERKFLDSGDDPLASIKAIINPLLEKYNCSVSMQDIDPQNAHVAIVESEEDGVADEVSN